MRGVRLLAVIMLPAFLWSCTNAGVAPPQNIASLLTPQAEDTLTAATADATIDNALSDGTLPNDTDTQTASVPDSGASSGDTSTAAVETEQTSDK